jgi:hypothetical protein
MLAVVQDKAQVVQDGRDAEAFVQVLRLEHQSASGGKAQDGDCRGTDSLTMERLHPLRGRIAPAPTAAGRVFNGMTRRFVTG